MLRTSVIACTTVAVVLAPDALADEAAQNRLSEAKEVLKQVTAVQYDIEITPHGVIAQMAPTIGGTLLMESAPGLPIPVRFHGEGTVTRADSEPPTRFRAAFDGEMIQSIDFELEVVQRAGLIPGADALLVGTYDMILDVFVSEDPLMAEINAYKATIEAPGVVNGEPVDVVLVQYETDERAGRSRWHFAQSDGLPRRIDQMFATATGEASISFTLSNLNTEPTIDAQSFTIETPEGYVQSEFDGSGLLPVGVAAPDWTLEDSSGASVTLSELRGQVVLMDFWATWCAPCKALMPSIEAIHDDFKDDGLIVLGLITDEPNPQTALEYVEDSGYTYRQIMKGETISPTYRAMTLPVLYLIGRDGRIAYRGNIIDKAELREAVEAALAENVQ